jgi:nitrite reductase (cytochrome; ammonia-forming)
MEIISDNPIRNSESDLLDRNRSAELFAKHLFSLNYKDGLVVSVCGEWGSGKTSYINLMRNELTNNSIVIDFNPWMFSDTNNLVQLFFSEMSEQLSNYSDNSDLKEKISDFGEVVSSITFIPFMDVLGKALKFLFKNKKSFQVKRNELIEALEKADRPITVILDDIDRLSADELQSILKLVRLVGCFPNIIYILSFDKGRVVKTLNSNNIDGQAYLEKIIQVPFDIPKVSENLLFEQLTLSLDKMLGKLEIDKERWREVYWGMIKPTIKNIRDIRRYVSSLSDTVNQIGGLIDSVDLIGIEIIRVFYQDKFEELFKFRDCFLSSKCKNDANDKIVNDFIGDNKIYANFLDCLFGIDKDFFKSDGHYFSKNDLGKDKRISHSAFFNLYFNKVISADVNEFILAEDLFRKMTCQAQLIQSLSNIELNSLENVVRNLMEYESDFTEECALNAIPVLYHYLPLVPHKKRGMFDFGPDVVWSGLTYRLLQNIPKENIYNIILKFLNNCDLFAQLEIVGIIGYREGRGHRLVSESEAQEFENILVDNINNSQLQTLIETYKLTYVLHFYVCLGNTLDNSLLESEDILCSLLKSSIVESKKQKGNDPTVYIEEWLVWDWLIKIYGDEEKLHSLIDSISLNEKYKYDPVISLAIKYRNGWRPTKD